MAKEVIKKVDDPNMWLGHPTCRLSYFLKIREEKPELSVEEAMNEAEKRCLEEGKLHGVAKLVREAEKAGYKFV